MISALVAELCPETRSSASDIIDVYPVKPDQTKIKVSREYVNIRLGIEISEKDYGEILSRLGISDNSNILTIPYNRLDLTKPEDIVEEVGRIYGYEKIMGKLPVPPAKPVTILPIYYLSEKIKNILIAAGFSEVYTYTLVSNGDIETAYPISKDKAFARKNMTDGMFECVKKNSANADLLELEEVCVFEMGRTFTKDKESTMLALGVAQIKKVKGRKSEDVLTEALQALYSALGIKNVPDLSKKIIIKNNCAVVELDLEELLAAYPMPADASYADLGFGPASSVSYEKISAYPFITRDIAVFVQPTVTASDVWSSIIKGVDGAGAQKILNKYSIYSKSTSPKAPFDTFEKDGKKSYAFRLAFQSMEKTLTDADAGNVMDKIYSEMKVKGWEVR
jgi:phenylalanyl-tRNA synthetase beta chain